MRKISVIIAALLMLAGCAALAPERIIDWNNVNQADMVNLKDGKIALAPAAVLEAASDALKAQGWAIEKTAGAEGSLTTARKHGVTFYGSCDYAMSCSVTAQAAVSKLSWYTISYVTQFLTKVDPVGPDKADKWNIAVYEKLAEKGLIAKEKKPEATAVPAVDAAAVPATTAVPGIIKDTDLPPPPKEE